MELVNKPMPLYVGQRCVFCIGTDQWAYTVIGIINSRKIVVADNRFEKTEQVFTLRKTNRWSPKGERYKGLGYLDFTQTETILDPRF